jgi:hypothetical protein
VNLSETDVPERQGKNCNHKHQSRGHEFLRFHYSHRKDHDQQCQQNVRHVILKYDAGCAKAERGRECRRHHEGNLALGLEVANQSSDYEQNNVNPQNLVWSHVVVERLYVPAPAKDTTNLVLALYLNTQDFAGFAFDRNLEWPATDLAIGRKPLRRNAGIDHDFKPLTAKWALDGFGNFHIGIISGLTLVASVF